MHIEQTVIEIIVNRVRFSNESSKKEWEQRQCAISAGLSYEHDGEFVYYSDEGDTRKWADFNNRISQLKRDL